MYVLAAVEGGMSSLEVRWEMFVSPGLFIISLEPMRKRLQPCPTLFNECVTGFCWDHMRDHHKAVPLKVV